MHTITNNLLPMLYKIFLYDLLWLIINNHCDYSFFCDHLNDHQCPTLQPYHESHVAYLSSTGQSTTWSNKINEIRILDDGYRSNTRPGFHLAPPIPFSMAARAAILKNHPRQARYLRVVRRLLLHDRLFIKPFTIINNLCRSPLARRKFTNSSEHSLQNLLSQREGVRRERKKKKKRKKNERGRRMHIYRSLTGLTQSGSSRYIKLGSSWWKHGGGDFRSREILSNIRLNIAVGNIY